MKRSLFLALTLICLISRAQNPNFIKSHFSEINRLINGSENPGFRNPENIAVKMGTAHDSVLPGQNPASMMAGINLIEEFKNDFNLTDLSTDQQVVIFPQGWSGVSSFINPDEPAIETLFAPLADKLVIIYNFNGMYYPSQVINTLGNWDPQAGYIAKFTQETNLEFKGQVTQNRTLNLTAGWNLIPVLSSCPVDVATFFQNSGVVVVKDVASWKLYWPDMGINNLYTLSPGKAYFLLMSSPAELTFTDCSTQDWECGDPLTDNRDGQVYPTVQIGAQCWMAKNLNFGARLNGIVPQTNNNIIEKYCYNNNETNCTNFGGLYQWDEMMKYSENPGAQGICPEGWYIPPDQEWNIMTDLLGGFSVSGGPLKEAGTAHWSSPNTGATNASGFTALPGGVRGTDGSFSNLGYTGNFWTSSLSDASSAHRRSLSYTQASINAGAVDQNSGMSVRCRKRETLSVNPESQNLGFENGSVTLEVTSGTSWSVQENIPWLTVEPMTGNQNGILTLNYDINISGLVRNGEIIILADGGSPVVKISLTQDTYIWACGDTIIDTRDGNVYQTVQIGNQCWMAENLDYGQLMDEWDEQTDNGYAEKYCSGNDESGCEIYGALYQWDEMMQYTNGVGLQGICPNGWHLPELTEWDILNNFLGGYNESGGALKSTGTFEEGTGLWYAPNVGATNTSGFTALPAGYRLNSGGILDLGYYTMFWSSDYHSGLSRTFALTFDSHDAIPFESETPWGYSVRCLKNEPSHTFIQASPVSTDLPAQSGSVILNIQSNTNWTIDENINWLTLEPSSGSGNTQITVTFDANIIPDEREAILLIQSGERSFEISLSQQGIIPVLTVTPTHKYVPQQGDTLEFLITSNTLWTIENNESWFAVTPANGSLNGTITLVCNSNEFPEKRIGQFSVTATGGTPTVIITITQFGNIPWACGDSIVDFRDSKFYGTVQIGDQCWMSQNLNTGNRINGTQNQTDNGIIEKYCYNNDEANCDVYGGLYQWDEIMEYSANLGSQDICPGGWHVPSNDEWTTITTHLGGENMAGGEMKEIGINHWFPPNTGANNSSGFTALPGGVWNIGTFISLGNYGYWWSSSKFNNSGSWGRFLSYNSSDINGGYYNKNGGFSVRCLKYVSATSQLEVTPSNQDVTAQAETTTFEISSNTSWTVTEDVSWLSVSPTSGSENGTFTVTYDANTESTPRIGEITVTTASGNPVVVVTVSQAGWSCGTSIIDTRDGKTYATVQIGSQCWMGQNMNIGTRIDGVNDQSNDGNIEKYCYNNDEENCDVYGGLYQWNEMMEYSTTPGVQGICPVGWHVPTDSEWCTLTTYLDATVNCSIFGWSGLDCGGKMKETDILHWSSPNTGATNISGFTALPGGYRSTVLSYYGLGLGCNQWSSTQYDDNNSWYRGILNSKQEVDRGYYEKVRGYSVRCLKDVPQIEVTPSTQIVTPQAGTTTFNISSNTSWEVTENVSWLSVSPTSGSDNGTLTVSYDANIESTPRIAEITITAAGGNPAVVVTVSQAAWSCGNSLTDTRDGKSYTTVQIGTQCWMGQNLNVGTRIGGGNDQTNNGIVEKYCYNNDEANCEVYGGLYQWNEMMQYSTAAVVQGICPTGWHLPSDVDWTSLESFVSSQPAYLCNNNPSYIAKALAATTNWSTSTTTCAVGNNINVNNTTGFSGLPAGGYHSGLFLHLGSYANFWSTTLSSSTTSWGRYLLNISRTLNRNYDYLSTGFSVRCLKDETTTYQLEVIPSNQDVNAQAGTTTFNISSNTSWTVTEDVSWLSISPTSGSENGTLTVTYDANTESNPRIGEITVTAAGGNPVVVVTVSQAGWACGNSLTDTRDGKNYTTVQIGVQCWMGQNLNIGDRIDLNQDQHDNATNEKYCYNNLDTNCDVYGGLYQWYEMMQYNFEPGIQGICPNGWHLPTAPEWSTLINFLDGESVAGGKMKEIGTSHWNSPNTGATNSSGFTALPAGWCYFSDSWYYSSLGSYTVFWSSTGFNDYLGRYLYSDVTTATQGSFNGWYGLSVRCLKDN